MHIGGDIARRASPGRPLVQRYDVQADQADEDQIGGDDKTQQARHEEDEDAGDKRDDRLDMSNTDDPGNFPVGWR